MGGKLTVKSTKGKGSKFTFALHTNVDTDGNLGVSESGGNNTNIAAIKGQLAGKRHKALIVEDYAGNVVVVSHMLKNINVSFDHAENGKQAVEMSGKKKYDFILMDIQMPEMDGIQATISIRDREDKENLDKIPIMGMTAHAMTTEKDKCFRIGMNEFITKPINENEFYQKIFRLIKRKTA